uniref:DNA-damage regulated autophagy modulator 1 n=1 Tax=Oryzias melastigma TaxID=30732 RepID=A0A3B3D363_ORYME
MNSGFYFNCRSYFTQSYLLVMLLTCPPPLRSDTGANPPESCIFGLMTIISACAGTATIYARYKFVERLNEDLVNAKPLLNKCALWFGMTSCVGMCIVATFQETAVTYVHDFGALVFFISGVGYIILQTRISYFIYPLGSTASMCRARVAITIIAALAVFPTVICTFFVKQTQLHRHKEDKDYPFHVASAVCEWIVAFSFVCFFLTYLNDFQVSTDPSVHLHLGFSVLFTKNFVRFLPQLFTLRVKTEYGERS